MIFWNDINDLAKTAFLFLLIHFESAVGSKIVFSCKCQQKEWSSEWTVHYLTIGKVSKCRDFDVESDFPRFLGSVFQRTDQISQTKVDEEIVEQHNVIVDQTVRLLRVPRYTPRQQFEY